MKPVLSSSEQIQVKQIITNAGKKLIKLKGARVLASKNIGHLSTNTVTQVDIDTENFLREQLVKQFPTFGFYGEESAKESIDELKKELVWVVDPIDGTLNFSRNIPLYGISIGLLYQNRPVFGIIYLPEDDELYSAHRNQGAYLGRRKLQVANRTNPKQLYSVLGHKGLSENLQGRLFSLLAKYELHTRGFSCTVYHLSHVASGQFDLMMAISLALWDIAAGWILVEEAGGKGMIVKEDNESKRRSDPYNLWFVAGNSQVVDWLTPKLRSI